MWSRDTVSIVLITDLLHSYSIVLILLYKKSEIIKYVLYSISKKREIYITFYATKNFIFLYYMSLTRKHKLCEHAR